MAFPRGGGAHCAPCVACAGLILGFCGTAVAWSATLTVFAPPTGQMPRAAVASLLMLVLVALVGALVMFSNVEVTIKEILVPPFSLLTFALWHLLKGDVIRESRGE